VSEELRYLYAVADASAAAAIAKAELRGIEGGRVEGVIEGSLLGATSIVPTSEYGEGPLNERVQNIDWLAPRAAAHQDVNGKLLELTGAVVPLAFGAIYRGKDAVRGLLRARDSDLRERLRSVEGRAEWIVAIERDESVAEPTDAVRSLDDEIAAAAPGRAFLLGKRREELAREERRAHDAAMTEQAALAIEEIGERVYREPLVDDPATTAIARFSVLAIRESDFALRDLVDRLASIGAPRGYRLRLSGPWPAYRFGGLPSEPVASG
jgi:gas vesicle protein GvpL/GvpF